MLTLRRLAVRRFANHGWLRSNHTFSFASYVDPAHMGFGPLRVINEDRVEPARGFGTHPHRDMEILTYVLEGSLAHKDSMGTGSVIVPGDVQRMSAGTGVTHSEHNASQTEGVHFLQIWMIPDRRNHAPGYEQKRFTAEDKQGRLRLVASQAGRDGSVHWNQDTDLYASCLKAGDKLVHALRPGRHAWLQVVRGTVAAGGLDLAAGDGLAVSGESSLAIAGTSEAELLLFDLP